MSAQAEAANSSQTTADGNPTPETNPQQPEAAAGETTPAPASGTTNHEPAHAGLIADAPKGRVSHEEADVYDALLRAALSPAGAAAGNDEGRNQNDETETSQAEAAGETETQTGTVEGGKEGEGTVATEEEEAKIPERIRIGGLPEEDQAIMHAATVLARTQKIPIAEAIARVSGKGPGSQSPATAEAAVPATQTQQAPAAPQVRSVETINADIAAARAEKKDAASKLDTVKTEELNDKITDLIEERAKSEVAIQRHAQRQERVFVSDTERLNGTATELYPDVLNPESAFAKRVVEIADVMEANKDPLVFSPDALLKISQMVGREMNIPPKAKAAAPANGAPPISTGKPVTPAKVQPVSQRAVVSGKAPAVAPASGAARTSQNGSPAIDPGKIRNADDYADALSKLGIKAF